MMSLQKMNILMIFHKITDYWVGDPLGETSPPTVASQTRRIYNTYKVYAIRTFHLHKIL